MIKALTRKTQYIVAAINHTYTMSAGNNQSIYKQRLSLSISPTYSLYQEQWLDVITSESYVSSKGVTWVHPGAIPPGLKFKKGGAKFEPPQKWGAKAPVKHCKTEPNFRGAMCCTSPKWEAKAQALPRSPVNGGDRCKKMILSIYCQYDGGDRCKKTILSYLSPTTFDNIILLHPSSVNVEYILGTPVTSDL